MSEPISTARVGRWRSIRRRITRPLARPITGICQTLVARSIRASMRLACLVMALRAAGRRPRTRDELARAWRRAGTSVDDRARERRVVTRWRSARSARARETAGDAVGQGVATVPGAGLDDLAGQRATDHRLHAP